MKQSPSISTVAVSGLCASSITKHLSTLKPLHRGEIQMIKHAIEEAQNESFIPRKEETNQKKEMTTNEGKREKYER